MTHLPVEQVLPELCGILEHRQSLLLTAEPGAGKTTRVPLALLKTGWLEGQRLLLLEPRRLAARAAAHYMARLLGESVGMTVGYRTRLDTKVGRTTRIEVVTEGILTRLLQHDPSLAGYGAVLFDGVITPGVPVPVSCTSQVETLGSGSKATRYELVATHVQLATGPPQPLSPPVDYDPEIAVKDPSGLNVHKGLWALAIIGGALLMWFIARRFRTSAR